MDNIEVLGVSQSGALSSPQGLENADFAGYVADKFDDLIEVDEFNNSEINHNRSYTLTGTVDTTDLPSIVHPLVGPAFGPGDVTSALAWDVVSSASNATIITTILAHDTLPSLIFFPVAADFSWSPAIQVVGQQVAFFDTSAGFPTDYAWDFNGDGVTDRLLANPVHVFGIAGSHQVELQACNADDCDVRVQTVTVVPADQVDSGLLTRPLTEADTFPSQVYKPTSASLSSLAADDFTVPAGGWDVGQIEALGHYAGGSGPAPFLNVRILNDSGGVPGSAVCTYSGLIAGTDYTDINGHFSIILPTPCSLTPGIYWLTVQADMDFALGDWQWGATLPVNGSPALWQNPGGDWSIGCTSWTNAGSCFGLSSRDLAMILWGPPSCSFGLTALELNNLTVDTSSTYQACQRITASDMQIVSPSTEVTLQAREEIVLGSGFSIEKGASLRVVVGSPSH